MATTDGRWALVSTSLTAMVAGAIAWLAVGMLSVSHPMVAPGRASLPYALFTKLMRASEPQTVADNADNANPNPGVESRTVTLDAGDTLAGMLEDVGISAQDANAVVSAMGKDFDPRQLKAGQSFDLVYSVATISATGATAKPAEPRTTTIMVNGKPVVVPVRSRISTPIPRRAIPIRSRVCSRCISRRRSSRTLPSPAPPKAPTRRRSNRRSCRCTATGPARPSIPACISPPCRPGIPADVVVDMIRMFSYKVDFQRDLQPGDSFEVYYDYYYTPEGQPAKYGDISYAMMTLDGKQIPMYRFQADPNEPAEYFDTKGESARGLLMKTPVDGARISSGFGSRFHPVLGYTRMHKGVDFAVPTGTPVMAAGSGTISFMGRANGYGNFVKISHGNGYTTGLRASVTLRTRHAQGRAGSSGPDICL